MTGNARPETYIHGRTDVVTNAMARRSASVEAAFFLPYLKAGMDLLDGGCGPGTITKGLAEIVAPGSVTGLDISQDQIEVARSTFSDAGLVNAEFMTGSITELPFDDSSFDAVFTNMVVEHIPDSAKVLSEIFRVLKSGGIYGARHGIASSQQSFPKSQLMGELHRRRIEDWASGKGHPDFGQAQTQLMLGAGFEIQSVSSSTRHFSMRDFKTIAPDVDSLMPYFEPYIESEQERVEVKNYLSDSFENPATFNAALAIETVGRKPN